MTISRRAVLLGAAGAVSAAGCSSDRTTVAPTPSATTPSSASGVDWRRLADQLSGPVRRPGSAGYEQVRLVQNPRYDGARPLAVVTPATPQEVATTLRFAQEYDVPVAIRSGGHSYPGWSAGARSLVLDCRGLNQVTVHGSTAVIGAGAALAPVYAALAAHGRAIPGGSCATVGIGGLTLGGGVGVLTRALGLTCDSVTGMQIVTADGQVRTVDEQRDPDLFWALRGGGGGHLGVVTSFTFSTAPAPAVATFFLSWPMTQAARVIAAWQAWAPVADPRLWSTCKVLGGTAHPGGPTVRVAGTWIGPGTPDLGGLLDNCPAPAVHTSSRKSYGEAMAAYAGCADIPVARCHTGPGGDLDRESFGATSHVGYRTLPADGITRLLDQVEQAQSSELKEAGLSMDALGGKVRGVAPGDTAFVHRDALMTVQYTATYTGDRGAEADAYVRGFRKALTPYWDNHAYVNYADPTLVDPLRAYFGANADRLGSVRATYDPDRFFTQPQGF